MTWKTVTLGEILTESTIPAITSSTDRRITVRLNVRGVEKRPAGNDKEGATKYFVRKAGQFIYGRQNLHKGAFGLVPPELDGYESSQDLPAFDIAKQCEPNWLIYFLRQGNFYESLDRLARGIGSRRVNPKDLYGVEIPLPPLDEQRVLLQTLAATDEAADALAQDFAHQYTLLIRLRQAVLREAVQGRLVSQDVTDEPASALLACIRSEKQRLVKEKKLRAEKPLSPLSETEVPYKVPEGWAWCRLGDVCRFIDYRGKTPTKTASGVRLITAKNIKLGYLSEEPKEYIAEDAYDSWMTRGLPEIDDVLFTTEAPLGNVAQLTLTQKIALAQRTILLRPFANWNKELLKFILLSAPVRSLIFAKSSGMTAEGIKSSFLKQIPIPLPPLTEQRRIVGKVAELLAHCTELEAGLNQARAAASTLHAAALREAFMEPAVSVVKAGL